MKKRKENRFRDNVRTLRYNYGETQNEFALALERSSGTVGNYESGRRLPCPEDMKRVANHFQVTLDELLSVDMVPVKTKAFAETSQIITEWFEGLRTSFSCSEKARKHPMFAEAYEWLKANPNMLECDEEQLRNRFDCMVQVYEEEGLPEAAAVCAWVTIAAAIGELVEAYFPGEDIVSRSEAGDLSYKDYLLSLDEENTEEGSQLQRVEKAKQDICETYGKELYKLLRCMRKEPRLRSLAECYVLMSYLFGFGNADLSMAQNKSVGYELLQIYRRLGNRYAVELGKMGDYMIEE